MTVVIDGKAAAVSVIEAVTSAATKLETSGHRKPGFDVVIVCHGPGKPHLCRREKPHGQAVRLQFDPAYTVGGYLPGRADGAGRVAECRP